MSQPAVTALAPPTLDFEIVYDDGDRLESEWHFLQLNLLSQVLRQLRADQQQTDVYVGGNQFIYYSVEQAREIAELMGRGKLPRSQGPHVFWVNDVQPKNERPVWIAWEEGGRLPDVVFELETTWNTLRHQKEKEEPSSRLLRTSEYFICGPPRFVLEGFRLSGGVYRPILPGAEGRLWSEQLRSFVGLWQGVHEDLEATWVRLYRPDGSLIPSKEEVVEGERRRAEEERHRADAAEAELARLRALLERQS